MDEPVTNRTWARARRWGERAGPAVLAAAIAAACLWSASDRGGVVDAAVLLHLDPAFHTPAALASAAGCVAAVWRRPPRLVPLFAVALAGQAALSVWPPLVVASYVAATRLRRPVHLAGFAAAAVLAVVGPAALAAALGALGARDAGTGSLQGALGGVLLFMVLPAVAGLWVRERRAVVAGLRERAEQLEREQDERNERARAQERARIAREMHDVVAHRVSVMVMQAGAIQVNTGEEATAADAAQLRSTGREALGQLRDVLGVLRSPGEGREGGDRGPQPKLRDLEALLERSRSAGVDVRRREEGEPQSLPEGVERTAYRIVQEGLTNVHRHADGAPTEVELRHSPAELVVTVRNAVSRTPRSALPGSGTGLEGLRERVELLGGELEAGRDGDGGFSLSARLPAAAGAPPADGEEAE